MIKSFGYDLCPDKPCVYKRRSRTRGGGLLVLHLEDIPLIENNDGKIVSNGSIAIQIDMKDLRKASHILEIEHM